MLVHDIGVGNDRCTEDARSTCHLPCASSYSIDLCLPRNPLLHAAARCAGLEGLGAWVAKLSENHPVDGVRPGRPS